METAIVYKQSGHTFVQLRVVFKITLQIYCNWLELKQETGSLNARKSEIRTRKVDIQNSGGSLKKNLMPASLSW
jgi:hypothetical protein